MCVNCVSNVDLIAANSAMMGAMVGNGVRAVLRGVGCEVGQTQAEKDSRVVAFLRSMQLDPAEILGADCVAAADALVVARATKPARRQRGLVPLALRALAPHA